MHGSPQILRNRLPHRKSHSSNCLAQYAWYCLLSHSGEHESSLKIGSGGDGLGSNLHMLALKGKHATQLSKLVATWLCEGWLGSGVYACPQILES